MDASTFRARQQPLKDSYRQDATAALVTAAPLRSHRGGCHLLGRHRACRAEAGLHPATGGDGSHLCSGDMLLEGLVACAGVTLGAVSTATGIELPLRDRSCRG